MRSSQNRSAICIGLFATLAVVAFNFVHSFEASSPPPRLNRLSMELAYSAAEKHQDSLSHSIQKLLNQEREHSEQPTRNSNIPNILEASTREQVQTIAAESLDDLTVFRFYSPFCLACRRSRLRFEHLAKNHPDITFVNVKIDKKNKQFATDLGVVSTPAGGIFHPDLGMVETMSIATDFQGFEKAVESFEKGLCDL